jgi:glycine cleavage system H protein
MVAIFVAFTFVVLVLTDLSVQKWRAWRAQRSARSATGKAFAPEALWQVPETVYLSANHGWFKPDPAGGLLTGADSLIVYAIGLLSGIELPHVGELATAGKPLFRLVRNGHCVVVPSSVAGRVTAVNSRLKDEPGLLNSEPYGDGWICRVIPSTARSGEPSMQFGKQATMWLEAEFNRLSEFLSAQVPPALPLGATSQDGGFPSPGCLDELPDAAWSVFEAEFLNQNQPEPR